jgi:hypothetical protein
MAQPAEAPKGGLQLGAALPKDRAEKGRGEKSGPATSVTEGAEARVTCAGRGR